ncbi:MAG: DinB family protein [Candidatus Thorarchaeota archaeon]
MNRIELIMLSISEQYGAALKMLEDTINECPEDLWQHTDGETIISQIVFHVLFWIDRYLSKNKDEERIFKPYMENKHQKEGKIVYSKQDLLDYSNFVRKKADTWFKVMTLDDLTSDSVYDFHGSTLLSSLMYDLRHIMLHVGALHVRLNRAGKDPMDWESHNILYKTIS